MMKSAVALRTMLNALTISMVAVGVFFFLKEPSLPNVVIPAATGGHGSAGQMSSTPKSADAAVIVSSNIFSATRAAPPVRYTPPIAGATSAGVSSTQDEVVTLSAPPPRVFGTMTGPNGATALIQPDSAGSSSRLYREGERVGAFRIEKILTGSVIVRGPSGRVELKVEQGEDRRE
ncbi:MAG: hypothetical protein ABIQ55_08575 [Gemmatimonadaceae bacterium]